MIIYGRLMDTLHEMTLQEPVISWDSQKARQELHEQVETLEPGWWVWILVLISV